MIIDKNTIEKTLKFYEIDNKEYLEKCYECIESINNNSNLELKINEILLI